MNKKPDCEECDYEWQDDSFGHEFGTEVCGHWECVNCGDISDNNEPPQHYNPDDGF